MGESRWVGGLERSLFCVLLGLFPLAFPFFVRRVTERMYGRQGVGVETQAEAKARLNEDDAK